MEHTQLLVGLQLIFIYIHFILNYKTKEIFMPFYAKPDTFIMLYTFIPLSQNTQFQMNESNASSFQAGKRLLLMFNRIKWLAELRRSIGQFRLRSAVIENDTEISEAHIKNFLFLLMLCVDHEPALVLLLIIFILELDQRSSPQLGEILISWLQGQLQKAEPHEVSQNFCLELALCPNSQAEVSYVAKSNVNGLRKEYSTNGKNNKYFEQ